MPNERGLTLIEVLATIILLFIISAFVFNFIITSKEEHNAQAASNQELFDNTYILKLLTKDIRKSTHADLITANEFIFKNQDGSTSFKYKYEPLSKSIFRNEDLIASNIQNLQILLNGNSIELLITNTKGIKFQTTLHFRRE